MWDVGIVMPVYRQDPSYLTMALRTVLDQSYRNFHFVIVSDGAPSETINVMKEVTNGDPRVRLIVKERNQGVASALNTGFDYLMTKEEVKFLTWVSSDNIYYPNFVEKHRETLKKSSPNVGLSYSCFRYIDAAGNYLKEIPTETLLDFQKKRKDQLLECCFIGVSFMYKKHFAKMIDGYQFPQVEDYEYWLRLSEVCDITHIEDVLMDYRYNSPLSISTQLNSSTVEKRKWRYFYNLAKKQARLRRKIPCKVTIIFPVDSKIGRAVKQLENLLEQTYSNYNILIIDYSDDPNTTKVLRQIIDPRITYHIFSNLTEEMAIREGIKLVHTPHTIVYGKRDDYSNVRTLNNLMMELQVSQNKVTNDNSLRKSIKEMKTMKLYYTRKLKLFVRKVGRKGEKRTNFKNGINPQKRRKN
ncbi:glycosyltransferase [Evansella sp. AB-rgal1]|uniref:glycosyltransferase n=1 Tax=Evansella sp. AB-rgal1 TaxID=3242696 RepID=UPI00359E0BE5